MGVRCGRSFTPQGDGRPRQIAGGPTSPEQLRHGRPSESSGAEAVAWLNFQS